MRGCGELGIRTCSVTTSRCEFAKLLTLETVSQPSLSLTSLLRFTARTVVAALLSGKLTKPFLPSRNLRFHIFRRRRANASSRGERASHVEDLCNIDIEQGRNLFQIAESDCAELRLLFRRAGD